MKLHRRRLLYLAAGAAALPAGSRLAEAEAYPTRPVHWIVSFTAGGPNDTVARLIGQYLSEQLGQQFVIENRVGAGGNIGMGAVLSSPPDGYMIGFAAPNNAINASLYEKLPFDFIRDSVPVAGTMLLTNARLDRAHQGGHLACSGCDRGKALGCPSGCADHRRDRAGL